jgi:2-dehydro-3-deoxyphosphooctonate aldolase (KDO 8-P synthase)
MKLLFETLKNKKFIMIGPNVIESEEHTMKMARSLKNIFQHYDITFIFKVSFDKANRTSLNSYRGVSFEEGLRIFKRIKNELNIPIITDIHESWQAEKLSEVVDIIQIPAFLCRQTDLLKSVAETNTIIHVKKGQFCSAAVIHKCKEKIISFGNNKIILCERGNSFGYQDLIVDPRNLVWLQSDTNLVSMDITHCLQQPAQKMDNGTIQAGGLRDMIPYMGKLAMAFDVNGIFMEVHDNPDKSLCDAPTQWALEKLEWLLKYIGISKNIIYKCDETCVVCKQFLVNYNIVYDGQIRGDTNNNCLIIECCECKHVQLIGFRENLKNHYDEDNQSNDIIDTFNISKQDIIDKEKIEINRRINSIGEKINLNNTVVLDVGGGYCTFAKLLKDKYNTCEITVLEPSKLRTDIGVKNNNIDLNEIDIYNQYLDDNFAKKNENKYDLITMWHVLEHIDDKNIDNVLINLYKCCKQNGKIYIEVPNGGDELLKLEKYRKIYYMIHHISYWTNKSLSNILNNNNINDFKIEYVQRYGHSNYLNWIYNLKNKTDCDMNTDLEYIEWINAKKYAKNTDGLLAIIHKSPQSKNI